MADLKVREFKMQEKRKQTPWRDFVKEICSWYPLNFYKNPTGIGIYPDNERKPQLIGIAQFEKYWDENLRDNADIVGSFFENFSKLYLKSYVSSIDNFGGTENADFCNAVFGAKNIYLSHGAVYDCENILYSFSIKEGCHNVLNSVLVRDNSHNVYQSNGIIKSFNTFYSRYIKNSSEIRFSDNLQGCTECIACSHLDNQSYCIENKQYNKEEYFDKKELFLKDKSSYMGHFLNIAVGGINAGSQNVVNGNFCIGSDNITNGLFVYNIKNGRNLILMGSTESAENSYDIFFGGSKGCNDGYGVINYGGGSNKIYNSHSISFSTTIYYSYRLENCSYCLGCVGLKNKSFCILNKQYTKEDRFEKANEIFEQMDKDGTLGAFFPGSMNPFYFNDTAAYLIDDTFTKEEVTAEGYLRRDEAITVDVPAGAEVIETKELNNYQGFDEAGEWKINPEILKKVIKDEKGNLYRIVPMELEFLQKHGLPLPEIHWLERIKLGFKFK